MADVGPSDGFLSKIFGKKKQGDVELPNESGKTDPRLKKKKKDENGGGVLSRYNPFDRVTSALKKASGE